MSIKNTANPFKRVLPMIGAVALALAMALPYILFREEIRAMALLGYIGLTLSCAISNASILLPTSSTVIVISAASALNPWVCVVCGGLGTALGEQVSYWCGRIGSRSFRDRELSPQVQRILSWYYKMPFLIVFLFAFAPLPIFDVIGVTAGASKMAWWKYTGAAVSGKLLKFLLTVFGVYYLLPALVDRLGLPLLEALSFVIS